MTTLDAKNVLIKIVNSHSYKLESSSVHLHFFAPLSIMHNENEGSILLYISQVWSSQPTNKKFMTKAKIFYYPLSIHKSNVIVLVNVASIWGYKCKSNYEESWLKGFFSTMSFEKEKKFGQSNFKTNIYIHKFYECLKGKTFSHKQHQVPQKNITWDSFCFL